MNQPLGDYFAGIQGENSLMLESAVLVSDVISCQESSGTISFLVWKSAIPAILRVCVRTPPTSEGRLECRQNVTNFMGFEWVPISIVIPVSTEPFQLVLIAEVQRMTDTIGIDNITYSGQICGKNVSGDVCGIKLKLTLRNEPRFGHI